MALSKDDGDRFTPVFLCRASSCMLLEVIQSSSIAGRINNFWCVFTGTNVDEAKKILGASGLAIIPASGFEDAAAKAVESIS